jgi:ribosomal protein S18 acetylase RimI-like enzyme
MQISVRSPVDGEWAAALGVMHRAFADQPFAREIYGEPLLPRWGRSYRDYVGVARDEYPVALCAFAGPAPVGTVLGSLPGACRACGHGPRPSAPDDPVDALMFEFDRNVAAVHAGQPAHAWITKLAVEPALQGHGIGRRLLDAAVAELSAAAPVLLECEPHREAFYVRAGFRRVATFADPAGPDALLLRREAEQRD